MNPIKLVVGMIKGCFMFLFLLSIKLWPETPGTKRPMRMFYVPLVLAEGPGLSTADSSCWFAYAKRGFQFPRFMKISAVPGSSSGVFNHFELFLKLLSMEGRPDRWEISECHYKHKSLKELRVSGVSNVVGIPGQVVAREPAAQQASAPSAPPADDFDMDFFDVPGSLSQMSFPAPLDAFRSDHGYADADDLEHEDSFFNFEEEEYHDSEIESEDDQQRRLLRDPAPVDLEEDRKSESGHSVGSAASGRMKSTATDVELLKNCLGEARPFLF